MVHVDKIAPFEDVQFLILLFIWVVLDLLIPISSMVFINSKGIFLIFFVVIFVEKDKLAPKNVPAQPRPPPSMTALLKLLIRSCGKGGVSEKSTWF